MWRENGRGPWAQEGSEGIDGMFVVNSIGDWVYRFEVLPTRWMDPRRNCWSTMGEEREEG